MNYSVDFNNLVIQLTPPLLRETKEIAWLTSLTYPIQWDNINFTEYVYGFTGSTYSPSLTYSVGDRVLWTNNAVYESTGTSSNLSPTFSANWTKTNDLYIGAEERVRYNSQKILLEYALNRFFQVAGTPDVPTGWTGSNHINQIWIENTATNTAAFIMGYTGPYSSNLVNNSLFAETWMGNAPSGFLTTSFTVWVPLALYNQYSNAIFRAYVDEYVLAGMQYIVLSY
jgi:hypothetical protein